MKKICGMRIKEDVLIIAEAGVNHNGDLTTAMRMVEAAARAGVNAVKFQTYKSENVVTRDAGMAKYQIKNLAKKTSQYDMIKPLELKFKDFDLLKKKAEKEGIHFLSTPFDVESADYLDGLGIKAFKVSSTDVDNLPFLKYLARKGKPMLMSTGMSTMAQVKRAIDVIRKAGNDDITLLQCTTDYPTSPEDVNLRVIETYRKAFKLPVGLSDHSLGTAAPVAAVALGAVVVEKHFTLDRNMTGPDHFASLTPGELQEMVKNIRFVEKALGDGVKRLTKNEMATSKQARRSIVAARRIHKGERITEEMLTFKRPGTGLSPSLIDSVLGTKAKKDIRADSLLSLGDLVHE
jgi:N,N'-diacetyllegionaminate synthase